MGGSDGDPETAARGAPQEQATTHKEVEHRFQNEHNLIRSRPVAEDIQSDLSKVYCDESGVHGSKLTGFGSLWITHERRGDLQAIRESLRAQHFAPNKVKWQKVKKKTEPFFVALIDEFFSAQLDDVPLSVQQQKPGGPADSQMRLGPCLAEAPYASAREQSQAVRHARKEVPHPR